MTLTIFRIMLLRLWNNPLELVLIFVVCDDLQSWHRHQRK